MSAIAAGAQNSWPHVALDDTVDLDGRYACGGRNVGNIVGHYGIRKFPTGCQHARTAHGSDAVKSNRRGRSPQCCGWLRSPRRAVAHGSGSDFNEGRQRRLACRLEHGKSIEPQIGNAGAVFKDRGSNLGFRIHMDCTVLETEARTPDSCLQNVWSGPQKRAKRVAFRFYTGRLGRIDNIFQFDVSKIF